MGCRSCGTENPAAARFCMGCGTALAATCAACGHANPPAARFCIQCGAALATPSGSTALAYERPGRSPDSYTPRHMAQQILATRAALEGERKQVTVLFADLKGSTELIQGLDPEQAQTLLDAVVTVMMQAVHRYEGTVNQILGDGIMALFGAPLAHEDHAVRACYAALAMQEAVRRSAEESLRRHGFPLQLRVGLNSGEVVVRAIANDLRMDYSAVGPTVHLAARMEQIAREGSTLLTAQTLGLAEGYVQVRPLGPVPVRGVAEPVAVFELVGARAIRTRLQALAARGLTHFVGRQTELAALHAGLERAKAGHGQVVALVGEPGVGKSRLVWELTHSHRTHDWTILESGSVSYGKATSYLPVIDLLKSYCRIEPRDDQRTIREKLTGKLLTLDEGLRPALPPLLALLDVPTSDAVWEAHDPTQRRRQTLDAVRRLLLRESQEQPLLLVFEDLHWIDAETQVILDSLIDSLPTAHILLVVNYRPEYAHAWGNRGYYTQLRIDPLTTENADELLASLLGNDPTLDALKSRLAKHTSGNPFFLEESVRSLVETGTLTGERGAHQLPKPLADVRVPPTVQAILAARIDRLAASEKRLLQIAAVIGKDVPDALLRSIADLDEDELQCALAALQVAEFMYEASLFPELEYTFKHALTHEVTYGTLLAERRKSLHTRVVDAIETRHADRLEEQVELLAHHALRGEVWEKALLYARRAGERASARSVSRAAIAYFEQALAVLARLPESRALRELSIDLRIQLRQALSGTGRDEEALEYRREAEPIALAIGDRRRQARIGAQVSFCLYMAGDYSGAAEASQSALAVAEAIGHLPVLIVARHRLGQIHWHTGEYRLAAPIFRQVIADIPDDLVGERFDMGAAPSVEARLILADCLGKLGDLAEPRTLLREALSIAETLNHPYTLMHACLAHGFAGPVGGDLVEAVPILERAHALTVSLDVPTYILVSASGLGLAYALAGRTDEAVPLAELGARIARSGRARSGAGHFAVMRGEAFLMAGRIDEAQVQAEYAVETSAARHERGNEAFALRLLAEIAALRESAGIEKAETRYRESLALAKELEMRPLQARCRLGLGTLYRRVDRLDEARAELSTAVEMLRAMEMKHWLPAAEAELAQVN
jgi:class 3 adenylate cyclase/tetratricopeptide (TPR) repeat protein